MLVSPSEPSKIKALGHTSSVPETYGADVIWRTDGHWAGVQRKEIKDLLASVRDGRLQRCVRDMRNIWPRVLIVEGTLRFTDDGVLMGSSYGKPWTLTQLHNLLYSVCEKDIWIDRTESIDQTVEVIKGLRSWTLKEHHSLLQRPNPTSRWPLNDSDWQKHFLQGLPGVGVELAERILGEVGMPFQWTVTKERLLDVPGLGKKKVEKIWKMFQ